MSTGDAVGYREGTRRAITITTTTTTTTSPSPCNSSGGGGGTTSNRYYHQSAVVITELDAITRLAAQGWILRSFVATRPQGDPLRLLVSCFAPRLRGTQEELSFAPKASYRFAADNAAAGAISGGAEANSEETDEDVPLLTTTTTTTTTTAAAAAAAAAAVGSVEAVGSGASLLPEFQVLPSWGAYDVKRAISGRLGLDDDSFRVFVGHGGPELHDILEPILTCRRRRRCCRRRRRSTPCTETSAQSVAAATTTTHSIRPGTLLLLLPGFTLTVLRRSPLPAAWAAALATTSKTTTVLLDPWGSLDRLTSLVCSRSGTRLAALCEEYPQVGVFSLLSPRKRWLPIRDGDAKQAVHVALSPDGALVAVGFKDGSFSIFNLSSGGGIGASEKKWQERVLCGPETRRCDRASNNNKEASNNRPLLLRKSRRSYDSATGGVLAMAFSVHGRWIAIARREGVWIFEVKTGCEVVFVAVTSPSRLVFVRCHHHATKDGGGGGGHDDDDNDEDDEGDDTERLAIFQPDPRELVFADIPTGRINAGRCPLPPVLNVFCKGPTAFSDCGKYVAFVHQQRISISDDYEDDEMIFSLRVRDLRSHTCACTTTGGDFVWESPLASGRCVHDVAVCGGNFPRVAMLWSKPIPALQVWDILGNNMCLSVPVTQLPRREEFQYLKGVNVVFLDQGRFVAVSLNASMASTSVRLWHVPDEVVAKARRV